MYFIIIATVIGIIIGTLTNHLAIKMLFHPYNAWKIGGWHIPFTPGLIPKRKEEIANRLGRIVEDYLFTIDGMKDFIDKSGFKEKIFDNIMNNIEEYKKKNRKVGEEVSALFKHDWQIVLRNIKDKKLDDFLINDEIRKKTLEEILSEETLGNIDDKIEHLSRYIIDILSEYILSLDGKRKVKSVISQLLNKSGVMGFLTGFIIDIDKINERTISYLDQVLAQEETQQSINKFLYSIWIKAKEEPIGIWIDKFEDTIKIEIDNMFSKGLSYLGNISINEILIKLEENNYIEKIFYFFIELIIERLNKFFSYLSISKVVETEVNNFSTELVEKMILDISGRELKMITYFGGVLGGLIGFLQGILYMLF